MLLIFIFLTGKRWTCWTAGETCKYSSNPNTVFYENSKGDGSLNLIHGLSFRVLVFVFSKKRENKVKYLGYYFHVCAC